MAKRRSGTHLIADIAQVSRGTVDRALHGRGGINEATRATYFGNSPANRV